MARPACLALALLAGLLCCSAAAEQGQSSFPQPLAADAWRYPEVGSHSQAELPAEAPSQPDALTASWGGSAAPRQAPAGAWGSPAPAPSALAPAPGHAETWLWHNLAAEETEFVQGMLPLDDNGNTVQAHGGGMLPWAGRFYWVGEGAKPGCAPNPEIGEGCEKLTLEVSQAINLYSSDNLASWVFEGVLVSQDDLQEMPCGGANATANPCRMERPKIIFNWETRKFVLFFHLDTADFKELPGMKVTGHVGILTADEVTGPYTWVRALLPDGIGSYDMSVFQDKDGAAYLVRSLGGKASDRIGISRLSPDYLDTSGTGVCSYGPRHGEGVAIFKPPYRGSGYYLLNSNQTWWDPNMPQLSRAPALCGAPWTLLQQPTNGLGAAANTTYDSQPTFVLPYQCASGRTVFMYLGDRWNFRGPGGLANASYVWLPLVPTAHGYEIRNLKSWRLRDFCGGSA